MGKRRKLSGKADSSQPSDNNDPGSAKLNIRTYADVADSEDEFHLNRDEVLLDEDPAQRRQRKVEEREQYFESSDEEILDVPDDESDLSEFEAEEGQLATANSRVFKDESESVTSERGAREGEEGWGDSKKDYYNADAIETEADALAEEQEALRLQKKQLQSLSKADFGFDEIEWLDSENAADQDGDGANAVQELIPQLEVIDSMTSDEKTKMFILRYPEFEPLSKEFLTLQPLYEALVLLASDSRPGTESKQRQRIAEVKASTLGSYLGVISMYFALLTSGPKSASVPLQAKPPAELRDHPIMDALVSCRSLWEKVKDVPLPDTSDANSEMKDDYERSVNDVKRSDIPSARKVKKAVEGAPEKDGKRRKSKALKAAELALKEANANRSARLKRTEDDLERISRLAKNRISQSAPDKKPQTMGDENDSDIGEETYLSAQAAAEKAQRRKGLRFYTSQIVQKSNKRENAGRDAGGDADIPYRERFRDRQARLNAEAEARGKKNKGAPTDALGGDSDEEDRKVRKEMRDTGASDEYYDLVASRTKEKKASKAAFASAQKEAAAQGAVAYEVEEVGPDGKRAITYAIEKNKGLTPKRKKDVRNPRVKKRKKFEEKKKKLGSIRQIYKGGEGRGGYGGELTGIKTNLVKSIKL